MQKKTDILNTLLQNPLRTRLIRMFVYAPECARTITDITKRARATAPRVRKELALLESVGVIKRERERVRVVRNPVFEALAFLIARTEQAPHDYVAGKLVPLGKLSFVAICGNLIGGTSAGDRPDIVIVGDRVPEEKLRKILREIERERGHEIVYALFTPHDFVYRYEIGDRIIRNILDFPHHVVIDKLPKRAAPARTVSTVSSESQ